MSVLNLATVQPWRSDEDLARILARQREAFRTLEPPTLAERRDDLEKLRQAVRSNAGRIAQVISADFGNRSRHDT
ncbi:MAG: hypothetical protein ABSD88_19290, partial [Candidatus Korobacteraceae bacterium]